MTEDMLNRLAAERCTTAQLLAEITRLEHAIRQRGFLPGLGVKPDRHVVRYQKRLAIYAAELNHRPRAAV